MKQKFIINLGRELGSGGRLIGEQVAEILGIDLYDKRLIKLAAKESGISYDIFKDADEVNSTSQISSILGFLRGPFSLGTTSDDILSPEALFQIQSDVIRDLAERRSCLFVGRCADYILRDHPLSVNIFITANREDRIDRISQLHNISTKDAEQMIDNCDKSRAEYYNFYGAGEWGKASSYDLCINSSLLGLEQTASYIVDFVRRKLSLLEE